MRTVLQVVSGPAGKRRLWLREHQSLTVGRTPRADFVIPEDGQISGLHFSLSCEVTQCTIRDLHSTNGTFVNNVRIDVATLNDGDVVRAGATQFAVTIDGVLPSRVAEVPSSVEGDSMPSPLRSSTVVDWQVSQYERYLDEAGFLYTQRLTLLDDPEIGWMDVGQFEKRLEGQIDGLAVGADLALDVCRRRLSDGEAGTLYAATRVFLRQHRRDLFDEVVAMMDPQDVPRLEAVADAARDGYPREWRDLLSQDLSQAEPAMILALLKVLALRRTNAAPAVISVLRDQNDALLLEVIRTLGRLGDYQAHDELLTFLRSDVNDRIKSASAVALLNLGAEHVIGECMKRAMEEDWPLIPLGYGGGAKAANLLIRRAEERPHPDCHLALGLLGMIRALNVLWEALPNAEYGAAAALGLHLITGAELYEEEPATMVAPPAAEETLLPEDDTVVARPAGAAAVVRPLTRDQQAWEQWWRRHRERFRKEKRYRLGRLFDPQLLVSMLLAEHSPHRLRELVLDELMIRYNLEYPFATDLFVVDQQQALSHIDEWSRTFGCRFEPGLWFFDGKLVRD